jgi:hypothetical protein
MTIGEPPGLSRQVPAGVNPAARSFFPNALSAKYRAGLRGNVRFFSVFSVFFVV